MERKIYIYDKINHEEITDGWTLFERFGKWYDNKLEDLKDSFYEDFKDKKYEDNTILIRVYMEEK